VCVCVCTRVREYARIYYSNTHYLNNKIIS